jgi:RNA polymerase sigma factor (sigma-70 family)
VANEHRGESDLPRLRAGARVVGRVTTVDPEAPAPGSGDRSLAELFVELRPAVRGVARYVLGPSAGAADLDDCINEVFRRVLERPGAGATRPPDGVALRPWVLGIARHVCLDARRTGRRARVRGENATPLEHLADGRPNAEKALELAERARSVQTALRTLSDEQRRAVLLHAEGFGYREIAQQLSRPLGTICTWISRARRDLAQLLGDGVLGDGLDEETP